MDNYSRLYRNTRVVETKSFNIHSEKVSQLRWVEITEVEEAEVEAEVWEDTKGEEHGI